MTRASLLQGAQWLVRMALAAAFLSAVADRFGLWGAPGVEGVAWGDWESFVGYVALLNGYAPPFLVPTLAWIATASEVVIALGLIIGRGSRWFALASGVLLSSFVLAMAISLGVKAPLDYSVVTAAAGSFLLAATLWPPAPEAG